MTKHPLLNEVQDGDRLKNISEEYGTPLYTYFGEIICNNLDRIDTALRQTLINIKSILL